VLSRSAERRKPRLINQLSNYCLSKNIKSLAVCAHTGFGGQISRKRLKIETRFQWDTNGKWHMADRLVTWPMTSSISLGPMISKMAEDTELVTIDHL